MSKLNRRNFLKASAVTVLGAAVAACSQPAPTVAPTKPAAQPTAKPAEPTKPAAPATAVQPTVPPTKAIVAPTKFSEAPALADLVKAGKLPPLDQRMPTDPLVVQPIEEIGQYGGSWRQVSVGDGLGWQNLTVYVEPWMKWTRDVKGFFPNLLQSFQWNATATELSLSLRKGIKWSDGKPLTFDAFMFWWDDMVNDPTVKQVEMAGMRIKGELMKVTKVDDYTLKISFAAPNPLFLPYMTRGSSRSAWAMLPPDYMKQFHPKYNAANKDITELSNRYNNRIRYPDMPVFNAWKTSEFVSGQRHVMERNPYYWKVDPQGAQLPYIDKLETTILANTELVTLKAVAGELDCQFRDFPIKDVPLLKDNEKKGDYRVVMSQRGTYAWPWLILMYDYPKDKGIEQLMLNKDFRMALSYGINRKRINEIVWLGLGVPRQSALSSESSEFNTPEGKKVFDAWAKLAADYNPDMAKQLLAKVGLKDSNNDKFLERADGTALEIIVDVPNDGDKMQVDAMDFIKQDWEAIGLKTTLNSITSTIATQRQTNAETMIRCWGGGAAAWGLISAPPVWTPIEGVTYCIGGMRFGLYYQSGGKQGIQPPAGGALEKLQQAYDKVISIVDEGQRTAELLKAYQIHIDEGPLHIGTVGDLPSAIVAKNNFRNIQAFGFYGPSDLGFPGTASPEQYFWKK